MSGKAVVGPDVARGRHVAQTFTQRLRIISAVIGGLTRIRRYDP